MMLHMLFQSAYHAAPYIGYHRVPGDSTGGSPANTGDPVFWLRSVATIRLGIAPTFAKHLSLATGCTKTCAEVGDLHKRRRCAALFREKRFRACSLAIHVCPNGQRGFDIKDIDLPPSSTLSGAQQGGSLPFRLETQFAHASSRGVPLLVKRDDHLILTSAPYSFLSHLLSAMVTP